MYSPVTISRNMYYGSNFWSAYSHKLKRDVRFYSDLEYEHWLLVETNSDIVAFCEQPLKIAYEFEGKNTHTIFDMWVQERSGKEYFVEVKYSQEMHKGNKKYNRTMKQLEIQRAWCEENGKEYRIMTEKEIREPRIYLDNMRLFVSLTNHFIEVIPYQEEKILNLINNGCFSVSELCSSYPSIPLRDIYIILSKNVVEGRIQANLDSLDFGYKTEVWSDG